MRSIRCTILITLILLLAKASQVQGTLYPANDPEFGPNSITVDTSTGLGWLDLTASTGLSYLQVLADTQPGGIYSRFRIATAHEVVRLYASAGIPHTGEYPASTASILSLLSLVGATSFQDGNPETLGISGTSDFGEQACPGIDFYYKNGVPTYRVMGEQGEGVSVDESNPTIGSWLVKSVPEPAVADFLVMAAAAWFGFMLLHRRERAAQLTRCTRTATSCCVHGRSAFFRHWIRCQCRFPESLGDR